MKRIAILVLCMVLAITFAACGSNTASDESTGTEVAAEESTAEETAEKTAEAAEPDVEYDYKWPESHREMLRNHEELAGKTIYCYGVSAGGYAENNDGSKTLVIRNEETTGQYAIIIVEGDLNENPLKGDYISAVGIFDGVSVVDGVDVVIIRADTVEIIPVD